MKDAQGYPVGTKYYHKIGDNPYFADAIKPGDTRIPGDSYSVPCEWPEYENILIAWEDQKTAQPAEVIDAETFNDALNVLPPCRWNTYAGINAFHVSERISGDLVHWYASYQGGYIRFIAPSTIDKDMIHAKWDGVM